MNPNKPQFEKYWRKRIYDELMTYRKRITANSQFLEGVEFGVDISANIALEGSMKYDR